MQFKYKIFLIGALTIGLFDALIAITSRLFNFNAVYFATGSFIIYGIFSVWGTKMINLKAGVLIAAAIGFFDSTVGWEISMLLKANTGNVKNDPATVTWIITIILVTGFAVICGLIGGGVAKYFMRKELQPIKPKFSRFDD